MCSQLLSLVCSEMQCVKNNPALCSETHTHTHTHRGRQAGAGARLTHRRQQEEPSAAQTPPMQRMDFLSFMSVSLAGASNMPINVLYTNRNRCSSVYHSSDYSHPAAPPRLHPRFSPMRFSGTLDFPFLTTHASRRHLQTQQ